MIDLDFEALRTATVAPQPFPHVVIERFVPPATLAAVVADLPPMAKGGSFPVSALRLGPAAGALMAALEGPEFREAIETCFDLDLHAAPTMVTLRGQSREKDGRIPLRFNLQTGDGAAVSEPAHRGLAKQEGCLRLLAGPEDLDRYVVEVPPVDGTLLVFPNGPTAWHGHKTFVGQRYVVQLNYMTDDSGARSELRRHRLSAFVKRLTSVG